MFGYQRHRKNIHVGGARGNNVVYQQYTAAADLGQLSSGDAKGATDVEAALLRRQTDLPLCPTGVTEAPGSNWETGSA